MLAATAIAIFVIPATFYVSQRFASPAPSRAPEPGRGPAGPAGSTGGPVAEGASQ